MIYITRTSTGLLIQRDAADIAIDGPAVPLALGPIIRELIDAGRALAAARLDSYNRGLAIGREQSRIEAETRARSQARQEADAIAELLCIAVTVAA